MLPPPPLLLVYIYYLPVIFSPFTLFSVMKLLVQLKPLSLSLSRFSEIFSFNFASLFFHHHRLPPSRTLYTVSIWPLANPIASGQIDKRKHLLALLAHSQLLPLLLLYAPVVLLVATTCVSKSASRPGRQRQTDRSVCRSVPATSISSNVATSLARVQAVRQCVSRRWLPTCSLLASLVPAEKEVRVSLSLFILSRFITRDSQMQARRVC